MQIKELISAREIEQMVTSLAIQIDQFYHGPILAISVLNGSFIFCADLLRKLKQDVDINFITASSYRGLSSTGKVDIYMHKILDKIKDKNILIIEDIVDTGLTLKSLKKILTDQGARSIKVVSLLVKGASSSLVDFYGRRVDSFVVGYGLDFNNRHRCLPYIATIEDI